VVTRRKIEQPPVLPGGLQLDADQPLQQRVWRAERVGWIFIAAVVLAALLGLFGPGPLSHTDVSSSDGTLNVQYLRFVRMGGTTSMQVDVSGAAVQASELRLRVDQQVIENFKVEQITPEPAEALPDGGDVIYVFTLPGTGDHATITFDLRSEGMGPATGRVEVVGGPSVSLAVFLYP